MVSAAHALLLLQIGLVVSASAGIASIGIVTSYRWKRWRRTQAMYGQPRWANASSGMLMGGVDRWVEGANPAEHSSLIRLWRWLKYQQVSAGLLSNLDEAEELFKLNGSPSWVVYAPSFSYLRAAYDDVAIDGVARVSADLVAEAEQWLSWAVTRGAARAGVLGYYDPLSAAELSAPDDQKRMGAAVAALNLALTECARRHGADILATAEIFATRSGEFTRAPQGHYELNNIGHGVQAGLIKGWLLSAPGAFTAPTAPERLFELAVRVGASP